MNKSERRYYAISIKHTIYGWKFGKAVTLWGYHKTADNEERCWAGYTAYPDKAEVYSIEDWENSGYGKSIIKMDAPVHLTTDLCQKYKKWDTVLIDVDEYRGYCTMACLPTDIPY